MRIKRAKNWHPIFNIVLFTLFNGVLLSVYHPLKTQESKLKVKSGLPIETRLDLPDALKNPDSWPTTAPVSIEQFKQTGFPDPAFCCDLDTSGFAKRKVQGPDGGEVSVYANPKNYTWKMKNNIKIWSAPSSLITLSYKEHKVWSYRFTDRRGNWNRRAIWQFPDGSKIIRYYNPAFKRFIYTYDNTPKRKIYNFFVLDDLLPESREAYGFRYHYKKKYAHMLDFYLASRQHKAYQKWLAENWNIPKSHPIPFLIFETEKEYNDYLQEKKLAMAGGRGYAGLVLLCCGNSYGEPPKDRDEFEGRVKKSNYAILMHELTHNRMKQACFGYEDYGKQKEQYPGRVYSEGMAEWAVTKINIYYRDYLLKNAHKLATKQKWDYTSLEDTGGKYYYSLMFAFWDYLEHKYGKQSLLDYHRLSCLGHPNDEAATKVWGNALPKLFDRFFSKFKS